MDGEDYRALLRQISKDIAWLKRHGLPGDDWTTTNMYLAPVAKDIHAVREIRRLKARERHQP